MKFLHTSDWHLGRNLYGKRRRQEFEAFLDWLLVCIETEAIDLLLVAGDIFDTTTPSNWAQELYYRFLCRIATTQCKNVIIIGGNHDSPSFLNAPRRLLAHINVHVVGAAEDVCNEVIEVQDHQGHKAIVCAVPFLRDKDVRKMELGESVADKQRNLVQGIGAHYAQVLKHAKALRTNTDSPTPIIGMGHLFTTGGKVQEDDGVRDLYVGSLATVHASMIAEDFDYLALGHLHIPQRVDGRDHIRYSGSPIPMGFGEAKQTKQVIIGEFTTGSTTLKIKEQPIPCFQKLLSISGDFETLSQAITELVEQQESLWLEVSYTGKTVIHDLRGKIEELCQGSSVEVLRIQNNLVRQYVLGQLDMEEKLDDLAPGDVFNRCLQRHEREGDEELIYHFNQILTEIAEGDGE